MKHNLSLHPGLEKIMKKSWLSRITDGNDTAKLDNWHDGGEGDYPSDMSTDDITAAVRPGIFRRWMDQGHGKSENLTGH